MPQVAQHDMPAGARPFEVLVPDGRHAEAFLHQPEPRARSAILERPVDSQGIEVRQPLGAQPGPHRFLHWRENAQVLGRRPQVDAFD